MNKELCNEEFLWLLGRKDLTLTDPCHDWKNGMNIGRRNNAELERSEGELLINLRIMHRCASHSCGSKIQILFSRGKHQADICTLLLPFLLFLTIAFLFSMKKSPSPTLDHTVWEGNYIADSCHGSIIRPE